jgi:lauroyl/myristoyl acyltransferase
VLEGWVREQPEQWLWAHRRWKVHDHPEGWEIPPRFQALLKIE